MGSRSPRCSMPMRRRFPTPPPLPRRPAPCVPCAQRKQAALDRELAAIAAASAEMVRAAEQERG